ncbi:MAG: alanine racemase [Planctomyces sp.]
MSRQPEFAAADIDITFSTLSSATHWCPQIRVPCPAPQFAQILQLLHTHAPHRTPEIACADLHTAEQLPLNHAQDCRLLLCCPIVRPLDVPRLAALASAYSCSVVVGHFRHVELVAAAAQAASQRISILIELSMGRQLTGVTPGPDACNLASAVRRLPKLQLRGMFLRHPCHGTHEAESQRRSLLSGLSMCRHTLQMLQQHATDHDTTNHDSSIVLGHLPGTLLPDFHGAAVCNPWPHHNTTPGTHELCPLSPSVMPALIIARPALDLCVAASFAAAAAVPDRPWQISRPAGAVITDHVGNYFTLQLDGAALDLKIGDEIELEPPSRSPIRPCHP